MFIESLKPYLHPNNNTNTRERTSDTLTMDGGLRWSYIDHAGTTVRIECSNLGFFGRFSGGSCEWSLLHSLGLHALSPREPNLDTKTKAIQQTFGLEQ